MLYHGDLYCSRRSSGGPCPGCHCRDGHAWRRWRQRSIRHSPGSGGISCRTGASTPDSSGSNSRSGIVRSDCGSGTSTSRQRGSLFARACPGCRHQSDPPAASSSSSGRCLYSFHVATEGCGSYRSCSKERHDCLRQVSCCSSHRALGEAASSGGQRRDASIGSRGGGGGGGRGGGRGWGRGEGRDDAHRLDAPDGGGRHCRLLGFCGKGLRGLHESRGGGSAAAPGLIY